MVYSVKSFAHIKIYDRNNFLLVDSAENKISGRNWRRFGRVPSFNLLPLCFTDILWLDVRYRVSCTTLSHTLESIGSSEIGL